MNGTLKEDTPPMPATGMNFGPLRAVMIVEFREEKIHRLMCSTRAARAGFSWFHSRSTYRPVNTGVGLQFKFKPTAKIETTSMPG